MEMFVKTEGWNEVLGACLEEAKNRKKPGPEFTKFDALIPGLLEMLLPEKKCRITVEYDPAELNVRVKQEF